MNKLTIGLLAVCAVFLGFIAFKGTVSAPVLLQGNPSIGTVYTTSGGFTESTTTINTTSTQVFSSVNQISYIQNYGTSTIWCSLDSKTTTAASSSVATGIGVVIGSISSTINGSYPSVAAFGQCVAGTYNCFPHAGTVNCLANVATVVSKLVQ